MSLFYVLSSEVIGAKIDRICMEKNLIFKVIQHIKTNIFLKNTVLVHKKFTIKKNKNKNNKKK